MKRIITTLITVLLIAGITVVPTFAATNHTYSKEWSSDYAMHWHDCLDDPSEDGIDVGTHDFDNDRYKCSICGYIREAHKHNYQTKWSTNAWSHWHACLNTKWKEDCCLDKCDEEVIDKESHTYVCSEYGCKCSVCGYVKDHYFEDDSNVCNRCGYVKPADHVHDWTQAKKTVITKPTCTTPGKMELTCTCSEHKTETIPATGHDFSGLAKTCKNGCGKANPDIITTKPFMAKVSASTNYATCSWDKVSGATSYKVYMATKNGSYKYITTTKSTSYTKKKLTKKAGYKFYVKAYKGSKYVSKTPAVYAITSGAKSINASKVTAKTSLSLSKGGKGSVSATVSKSSSKKSLYTGGCSKLRYYTNSSSIATVNAKGEVTAKKTGKCYIYAVAPNGLFARTTVAIQ